MLFCILMSEINKSFNDYLSSINLTCRALVFSFVFANTFGYESLKILYGPARELCNDS